MTIPRHRIACLLLSTLALTSACFDRHDPPGFGPVPAPPRRTSPNPLVTASGSTNTSLPPISGGTLLITLDGERAVVSDPDSDQIAFAQLSPLQWTGRIALRPRDEPGRQTETPDGTVWVVLRGAGEIARVSPLSGQLLSRRAVCDAPRGIAYDAHSNAVHVACADGTLATFDSATDAPAIRTVKLAADDLRDVVVTPRGLSITRFRAAEVLEVDRSGRLVRRTLLRQFDRRSGTIAGTGVAWRAVPTPEGGVAVVHQRMLSLEALRAPAPGTEEQPTRPAPSQLQYGSASSSGRADPGLLCRPGLVQTVVTIITPDGVPITLPPVTNAPLPVDLDFAFGQLNVASAGLPLGQSSGLVRVDPRSQSAAGECSGTQLTLATTSSATGAQLAVTVAVAHSDRHGPVALTRSPVMLRVGRLAALVLDTPVVRDVGHTIFHASTGAGMACASCHPEGGDDGHVWRFTGNTPRRTQNLRAGIAGTYPLHWEGDMPNFQHLANEVFSQRMSGPTLGDSQAHAIEQWIDRVSETRVAQRPAALPAELAASVRRGREVFLRPDTNCAGCHSGERLTNNLTVDVGTGEALQVPSLVGVRWRSPYMHNGCAPTLRDRFTDPRCGGGDRHGRTSQLAPGQIDDLIAYLQTL